MPNIIKARGFQLGQIVYTDYIGWERKKKRVIIKMYRARCQTGIMVITRAAGQVLNLSAGWYQHSPPQPSYYPKIASLQKGPIEHKHYT